MTLRRFIARLFALALLALAASCAAPIVRDQWRYLQLLRQAAPAALPVPVEGVSRARLHDSWGDPRSGGRTHEGIDIFAPRGTPVRSTTEGLVHFKGERGLGGRVVSIVGPGGYRHYYAHLDDWGPQAEGDWVLPGDVVGYVGSTGNAAGGPPHLHYGIYEPWGGAINPYPLLVAPPPEPAGTVATGSTRSRPR